MKVIPRPLSSGRGCITVKYGVGTEIHKSVKQATSVAARNTAGETIATCTEGTARGQITQATGTWVVITYTTWVFGHCSQTTDILTTGSDEIMKTGVDEGEVVGKNYKVTLSIFGVSCVYGTGEGTKLGTIKGGEAPELVINAALPRIEGGFLCPSTSVWATTVIVTSPHAYHVVE